MRVEKGSVGGKGVSRRGDRGLLCVFDQGRGSESSTASSFRPWRRGSPRQPSQARGVAWLCGARSSGSIGTSLPVRSCMGCFADTQVATY